MKTCDLCGKNKATDVLGILKEDHDGSIIDKTFLIVCSDCGDRFDKRMHG